MCSTGKRFKYSHKASVTGRWPSAVTFYISVTALSDLVGIWESPTNATGERTQPWPGEGLGHDPSSFPPAHHFHVPPRIGTTQFRSVPPPEALCGERISESWEPHFCSDSEPTWGNKGEKRKIQVR